MNNFDDNDIFWCLGIVADGTGKYVGFGEESSSEGTPHLQGYCVMKEGSTLAQMKKYHDEAHWEPMGGTLEQNKKYCSKEGKAWHEAGKQPKQGQRTDLEAVVETIRKRKRVDDVIKEHPVMAIKFHKGIERVHRAFHNVPTNAPFMPLEVVYIWGPTGAGKSRRAREIFDELKIEYFVKSGATKEWWDGYSYEPGVIMDEFRDSQYQWSHFLDLLNGYPHTVQVKGGSLGIQPRHLIITSDRPLEEQYKNVDPVRWQQLKRRVTTEHYMGPIDGPQFDENLNPI